MEPGGGAFPAQSGSSGPCHCANVLVSCKIYLSFHRRISRLTTTSGLIHVLQVLIGRASFFWDEDHDSDFLPEWGMPGKIGQNLAHYPTDATRDVLPIACHSHNDYWRRIPLFEAIHYGCTGVEADVWVFDDDLYVGHSQSALSRNRTFRSMYVDPLVELLDRQNPKTEFADVPSPKHGVFDVDSEQTLVLLVDFKTDGYETWSYVESQLSALRDKNYLTYWNGSETVYGPVTVVGTGNTPYDKIVANQTYRDIFFDAPLDKLWEMPRKTDKPAVVADAKRQDAKDTDQGQGKKGVPHEAEFDLSNSYYASVSFTQTVGLVWKGHLSPAQMDIIRGQIRGAKRRGLKARYWGTPEWPISARNHVWHVLMKEGADVLNVDDLKSAAHLDWRKWKHDWW